MFCSTISLTGKTTTATGGELVTEAIVDMHDENRDVAACTAEALELVDTCAKHNGFEGARFEKSEAYATGIYTTIRFFS